MKKGFVLILLSILTFSSCKNDDDGEKPTTNSSNELVFSGEIQSCGNFSVTQLLNSQNTNISLTISTANNNGLNQLNLTSFYKNFSLPDNYLKAQITTWDLSVNDHFCNDIIIGELPKKVNSWQATSGKISLKVSNITKDGDQQLYDISIKLENLIFENTKGEKKVISNLTIDDTRVGWFAG